MNGHTRPASRELEREWWLRALLVLQSPRPVFAALRDDSEEAAAARQEPLTAIVFLAGISIFLSTKTAAHIFDTSDPHRDLVVLVVEAIVAGALVALQNFWILGGALYFGTRGVGGGGSYRQARHLVGLATTPFVLSLLIVWPVRLALYGIDLFESGGSDEGAGGDIFRAIDAAFAVWALALLVIGVRALGSWSWRRSLAAASLAALVLFLFVALFVFL